MAARLTGVLRAHPVLLVLMLLINSVARAVPSEWQGPILHKDPSVRLQRAPIEPIQAIFGNTGGSGGMFGKGEHHGPLFAVQQLRDGRIAVGGQSGLFFSADEGLSWTPPIHHDLPGDKATVHGFAIKQIIELTRQRLLLVYRRHPNWVGDTRLLITDARGGNARLLEFDGSDAVTQVLCQPNRCWAGRLNGAPLSSNADGESWEPIPKWYALGTVYQFLQLHQDQLYAFGEVAGQARLWQGSADAGAWRPVPLPVEAIRDFTNSVIEAEGNGGLWIILADGRVARCAGANTPWQWSSLPKGFRPTHLHLLGDGYALVSLVNGYDPALGYAPGHEALLASPDGGITWEPILQGNFQITSAIASRADHYFGVGYVTSDVGGDMIVRFNISELAPQQARPISETHSE